MLFTVKLISYISLWLLVVVTYSVSFVLQLFLILILITTFTEPVWIISTPAKHYHVLKDFFTTMINKLVKHIEKELL